MPGAPAIADDVLLVVARHLNVPQNKYAAFKRMLRSAVKEAWRGCGATQRPIPRRSPVLRVLGKLADSDPKARTSLLASGTIHADYATTMLQCAIQDRHLELGAWLPDATADELARAVDIASKWVRRDLREGGRTPGTTGNAAFDLFIYQLYYSAFALGGKPGVVSRHGRDPVKGPMVNALYDLRSALPKAFIPTSDEAVLNAIRRVRSNVNDGVMA